MAAPLRPSFPTTMQTETDHWLSPEPQAGQETPGQGKQELLIFIQLSVHQSVGEGARTSWLCEQSGCFRSINRFIPGTNWMLEILSLIRCEGDPGWVRSVLNWDRAPWIDNQTGLEAALKYPSPRLLTSHLPLQLFPKSWQHSKAKVIYTLRCPKDVLVSLYHFSHFMHIFKVPSSMDSFLEDFLSGNVPFGSWFDHVTGWMGLKGNENFFFITYEELQQDPGGSVRRICRFLGKELCEEQVASVVENASFQSMKGNQMSNFSQIPDTYVNHEKGELLRKGKTRV
uniref:Sulfotransferase n=1 Tax=Pelusios castaneus TaxID=367368 RepID=A0A8C8REH5_9SAUR